MIIASAESTDRVSTPALGCGGPSRLGLRTGHDEAHAASLVDLAISLGVSVIDTAESYGTENAVGRAVRDHDRSKLVISTKTSVRRAGPFAATARFADDDHIGRHNARPFVTAGILRTRLEHSLRRLRTDYVDVYFLHALLEGEAEHAIAELVPELDKLRDEGKLRAVGVSEMFAHDTDHRMIRRVLPTGAFDVYMVGFNILNQLAREAIYTPIAERESGGGAQGIPRTMNMFSVRRALRSPEAAAQYLRTRRNEHALALTRSVDLDDPLGFVTRDPDIGSLAEAAYRFCAHEPGVGCVLTGTGDPDHLRENIAAIRKPPLPREIHGRIVELFSGDATMSGN